MVINFNKKFFNKKYINKINSAYDVAIKLLKIKVDNLEVNINFVSKSEIKDLNNKYRNIDKVTDVLSFPSLLQVGVTDMQLIVNDINASKFNCDIDMNSGLLLLGDICICKSVVYKHAREYENTRLREMVYMAVHGLLHLLGYDHIKDDDKKIMREMEEKIMTKINLERD